VKWIQNVIGSACVAWLAFGASPATAAPGDTTTNGTSTGIVTGAGFLFEPEVPFTSLKNVPTWSELEQLLDNPYAMILDTATPGNDQGFPSYRATIARRPAFGVTLPHLLVHPLNYNPTTGEEMRLINPGYPGGTFDVIDQLVETSPGTFTWTRTPQQISAGVDRVEPGGTHIDYNNPIGADAQTCVVVTELNPPEGSLLCGGDPGEPGYSGFSIFSSLGYSTPAVRDVTSPSTPISGLGSGNHRLFDPERGFINPRNAGTGDGGLRKPSLRVPSVVAADGTPGRPNNPAYTANTDPNAVTSSNENDFIRNRTVATALGKALFWDMQVGSDGVQSCGTCHFNGTGTDTRTKNQVNPNHIGGDVTLQLGDTDIASGGKAANYTLKLSDFPLHKLANAEIAGDPACTTPLVANVNAGVLENNFPNGTPPGGVPVCDATNTTGDVNDVVSSMGVHFGLFKDIAPVGTFVLNDPNDPALGMAVARDLRATADDCATAADLAACLASLSDPIPAFAGGAGTGEAGVLNQFRRVEPRNTPTMQAAAFNFDNFWDGRARHDFNGGSVFGAADPQLHVFVSPGANNLTATRQIIRFVSIASLATGPGLSEFEMSFAGRNWSKVGKKLLQGTVGADAGGSPVIVGTATPLANQLVALDDSVLGPYSNQGGSLCAGLASWDRSPGTPAPGKPGLCISYPGLIRQAYYPALWRNMSQHLSGCYTDGKPWLHPNQCAGVAIPVLSGGAVVDSPADPFDGYVLSIAGGAPIAADTDQFRQMEGNFSLFWGLSINAWVQILVPDDTPFDQVLDANPGAFLALGEPGEPGLVNDLLNCGQPGADPNYCFTEVGNFKRDTNAQALQGVTGEGGAGGTLVPAGGTRTPGSNQPDPLLGMDIFFASNLSLKNPNFRTGRCGECHAIPTLTDHTMPFTSKINLMDAVAEFATPGVELVVEPLARLRVISGFLLESEINENGQDAVERRIVNQSIVPNPVDGLAYPGATAAGLPAFGPWTGADAAFLDNGMYNLGIRPIAEDVGRGGNDAFGWPLSLATLMMKNLGGAGFNPGGDDPADGFAQPAPPGIALGTFDPAAEGFGLFEATAQDPSINPGLEGEPANPLLPPYLGDFANNITVGDFPPELDEAGGAIGGMVNTLTDVAMIEGFMDTLGPFNPANVAAEVLNFGGFSDRPGDVSAQMGTWPNVNRVGRMGAFKAAPLRNVELTGPYFHNGGKLTLRQVVDFYTRGGDFPISNAAHRDFNLVNMNVEVQSNLSEAEKLALVDYLLELTDERNRFDRAPFDHPQVILPLDGEAPDNTGRSAMLADPRFVDVKAVGSGGRPAFDGVDALNTGPEPAFMNVTRVRVSGADAQPGSRYCDYEGTHPDNNGVPTVSQYCH
jgi:cytochrome c peroxidase